MGAFLDVKRRLGCYDRLALMTDGSPSSDAQALGAELLTQTLRQARRSYDEINWSLFAGRLFPPALCWAESARSWGTWQRQSRTLALNPRLIDRGWGALTEVLKHEMAHQYVDEVLGADPAEGPHGATFWQVCRERGIDALAAGDPGAGGQASESPGLAVLKKIEALLSLAKSDNQHEAEVAMAQARRLMLRYNLSTAGQSQYSYRHLGKPTGRRMAWQRALTNVLSDFFFVSIIIVPVYRPRENKRGSVLEACGTPANLEMAAYVHDFLVQTAESLWRTHKREKALSSNRDKQSFLFGVISGFSDKLSREARRHREEGLVWHGDPELEAFFRRRHPYVRQVSGRGSLERGAFSEGHAAGKRIVLHRGVNEGQASGTLRLLGSGGRS